MERKTSSLLDLLIEHQYFPADASDEDMEQTFQDLAKKSKEDASIAEQLAEKLGDKFIFMTLVRKPQKLCKTEAKILLSAFKILLNSESESVKAFLVQSRRALRDFIINSYSLENRSTFRKIARKLFKKKYLLEKLLTVDFLMRSLFNRYSESPQTTANISGFLMTAVKDNKISDEIILKYFESNSEELTELFSSFINRPEEESDQPYFIKREVAYLLRLVLDKFDESEFKRYFVSKHTNVLMVFEMLNTDYDKIKEDGLRILQHFLDGKISVSHPVRLLLVGNKNNFVQFFSVNQRLKETIEDWDKLEANILKGIDLI